MSEQNTMQAIGERLRTQDNRITENPMFCVQEKVRDYGYDPAWRDDICWLLDGEEVSEGEGDQETGFRDRWETVMVAFTEGGCNEYLALNGHNHRGETRIFAKSFHRCPEMIAIRAALMNEPPCIEVGIERI